MLIAGAGLVLVGQISLRSSMEASLRQRVLDRTASVSQATVTCLGQAQPLLELIRGHVLGGRGTDPAAFAPFARALIAARRGVTYISFSGVDGSFRGVYLDHEHSEALRLNHSWIAADGRTIRTISDIAPDGSLTLVDTAPNTGYDPRVRPFYELAVLATTPVWTSPYIFYDSNLSGISCALAVRDPGTDTLLGVATVDFDLSTLGEAISSFDGPVEEVAFLFTGQGVRIATSGDLDDPIQRTERIRVVEFLLRQLPEVGGTSFVDLSASGMPLLVGIRAIQIPGGPVWYAAIRVPREVLAAEARGELNRSLAVGVSGLMLAVAVSMLFARYLTRQRRHLKEARVAAATARERLRSLGSYTIRHQLGAGGMGTVWQAEHRLLARPAALKLISPRVLSPDPAHQEQVRIRFEREARVTASLRSRNTITLYDYGVADDGSFYYAMELLDGLDLHQLVVEFGPQPPARVIQILIQACLSLGEAHRHGLVHRDIKPANIYLCRLGLDVDVVKVLDFGLVSERTSDMHLTAAGIIHGTPAFMAPEQAKGNSLDGRTDLYALGCVAYWLLTGRAVFDVKDPLGVMLAQINVPPPPIAIVANQPIPKALADLITHLLAKDPAHRPATAVEVIAALRAIPDDPNDPWTPRQADRWWQTHRCPLSSPEAGAASTCTQYRPQTVSPT